MYVGGVNFRTVILLHSAEHKFSIMKINTVAWFVFFPAKKSVVVWTLNV